jgi:hypothetical protein
MAQTSSPSDRDLAHVADGDPATVSRRADSLLNGNSLLNHRRFPS